MISCSRDFPNNSASSSNVPLFYAAGYVLDVLFDKPLLWALNGIWAPCTASPLPAARQSAFRATHRISHSSRPKCGSQTQIASCGSTVFVGISALIKHVEMFTAAQTLLTGKEKWHILQHYLFAKHRPHALAWLCHHTAWHQDHKYSSFMSSYIKLQLTIWNFSLNKPCKFNLTFKTTDMIFNAYMC